MTARKVMLLGGRGFIGSALARRLHQHKHAVTVITRDNLLSIPSLLKRHDVVVHLASSTTPGSSAAEPALEKQNLGLTKWLIELLAQHPGKPLIYFSSGGTVYGNPNETPVTEAAPLIPLSPYGSAKVMKEEICRVLCSNGSPVVVLRPSNAYGPGQVLKRGFGLMRHMLECCRTGAHLEVWGDGENIRDYLYIDDLVDATLRVIEAPQASGTYNIGSGVGHNINQIRLLVEQVSKRQLEIVQYPKRDADVRSVVLDASAFKNIFGWQTQVNLEQGMLATWQSINTQTV
jgi:UDP-glucose 4-epimerase